MGPAVSEEQLATDLDYVRIGREEGAELLAGGGRAGDGGHFCARPCSTAWTCTAGSLKRRSSAR